MMKDSSASDQRRKVFYGLILIAIILFAVSFSLSLNVPPQEQEKYTFADGTMTITPSTIYVHNFLWYSPSVFATVSLNKVTSTVQVSIYQVYNTNISVFNRTFHNTSFFSFYFGLHPHKTFQVENFLVSINGRVFTVSETVKTSSVPLLSELTLLASFILFITGVYLAPFRSKLWILPVGVSFLILSAFVGQRYDMFFMISGGMHILSGVNPFIASSNLPGTLKWTYPPYYLIWSVIADSLSGLLTHTVIPSAQTLVYPDVLAGNYYEAWLGFVPNSLPVYYFFSKLPMVVSVLAVYYILLEKFKLPYNLKKIWLMSPFVILIGVVWGQLDIIASAFLLLSVYYLQKGRSDFAMLASMLGFWVKIFPIFILPFILIESKHRLRDLGIMIISSIPALLIYLLSGNFVKEMEVMIYTRSVPTFNGVFKAQGLSWQVILSKLGIVHFPPLFLYLFVPFLIAISVVYYYKRGNVVNYLIMEFMFFFLTYNYVNPQYMIVLLPLFLINRDLWNYMVFSVYPFLLILLEYSFAYFVVPSLSVNYFASPLGQQEALRTWITASPLFIYPLLITFEISVVLTMVMLVRNKQFNFLKNTIFTR